jgi:hypothetical protein
MKQRKESENQEYLGFLATGTRQPEINSDRLQVLKIVILRIK